MKPTFTKLNREKQERIFSACIKEFGAKGYENGALDRIIQSAGISKGGLYEYIESKEDLFMYVVGKTYDELYDYMEARIRERKDTFPTGILERMRLVAEYAIDFFVLHPSFVALIVNTHRLADTRLTEKVKGLFTARFMKIFGDSDFTRIPYNREMVFELLTWLLLKTRYDFLVAHDENRDDDTIRKNYLEHWDFYTEVLAGGLYGPREISH